MNKENIMKALFYLLFGSVAILFLLSGIVSVLYGAGIPAVLSTVFFLAMIGLVVYLVES